MTKTPSLFPDNELPPPAAPKVPAGLRPAKAGASQIAVTRPEPYDLSADILKLIRELVGLDSLRHIDPDRLLVGITIARSRVSHGVAASCTPLRFDDGERFLERSGRVWEWPQVMLKGREILYCLNFTVPRFLNYDLAFKLETVVHELFHISPKFDGTLRRLGKGRHAHHGPSRAYYDGLIRPIWIQAMRDIDLKAYPFLNRNTGALRRTFGGIVGLRTRRLRPHLVSHRPAQ